MGKHPMSSKIGVDGERVGVLSQFSLRLAIVYNALDTSTARFDVRHLLVQRLGHFLEDRGRES
jgi:hypothetical protein